VILYQWASFLIEESFAFLQLTNPLDLDHVVFNKTASGSRTHANKSTAGASDCEGASSSLCTNDPRAMQDIASQEHLLPFVLEYDRCARQEVFRNQLFSCNVCMSEKLGNDCIAFVGCQHVFCADCMRRFLELHITEGNVLGLKCPTDKCESQIHQSQVFHYFLWLKSFCCTGVLIIVTVRSLLSRSLFNLINPLRLAYK
jgi:E3 ubiquitin-protein ligase RNF14